jgi:hypothetical protein
MSINCWVVLQLDLSRRRAVDLLTQHTEDWRLGKDYYFFLLQERYSAFEDLSPEDQEAKLELCLGDRVLCHLKDSRGVCVLPEVGQSLAGGRYSEMTRVGLWVACRAANKTSEPDPPRDPGEEAISVVMQWVDRQQEEPELAQKILQALLSADWVQLGQLVSQVKSLARFTPVFSNRGSRAVPAPANAPKDLQALLPNDAEIKFAREGAGSKQWQREYSSMRDEVFGEPFGALFDRASFGSPRCHLSFVQAATRVARERFAATLREGLGGAPVALDEGRGHTNDKLWISAESKRSKVFATYYRETGAPSASVSVLRVRQVSQSRQR